MWSSTYISLEELDSTKIYPSRNIIMKTRIHFEVLNSSKMVLNYRKNFVESCTINFMMQTAVMGAEYRSGLRFILNLWIKFEMMTRVPAPNPVLLGSAIWNSV